jgi:ATP-dependent exoDNAse (exonuclease V) beta subunit
VPYSASVPFRDAGHGQAVAVHAAGIRDDAAEGEQVAGLVAQALAAEPDASIAVLGRSRGHLLGCVRALKRAGIRFQAIDLEPLVERLVVQDLLALTRALLHAGDRLAWCTLLRSPVCGLALPDLLAAVGEGLDTPVWPRLDDPAVTTALSDDGRARVARLRDVLADALARRRRGSLRQWVEGAWIRLGGPATLAQALDRETAAAYFELLDRETSADDIPDLAAFDQALARLYAPPDPAADGRVQVMTMHKAKGLEFDVVILPGLGKSPRQDDPPLLDWRERPDHRGQPSLLLAPIRAAHEDAEPIQAFLRRLRTRRARLEDARLLYVAATRARRRLHLLGHATPAARTGAPTPQPQSLLARIWPRVAHAFGAVPATQAPVPAIEPPPAWPLLRLPADWEPVSLPPALLHAVDPTAAPVTEEPVLFDWAGQTARHVGTLVHRWLERIARDGPDAWSVERIRDCRPRLASGLRLLGVAEEAIDEAVERCVGGLCNAVDDPRGRWILEPHAEHRVEYALTLWQAGQARHYVIDRTFVDADGVRWIIDYKTGQHQGGDPEDFLDRERERYQAQLAAYAAAFARLEDRPIRLGLYFPLLPGWREWTS